MIVVTSVDWLVVVVSNVPVPVVVANSLSPFAATKVAVWVQLKFGPMSVKDVWAVGGR